ncbi:NnrS family protein [Paraferrimonas sedimenticola]|uniref:Short-chain dehydrogenase n=1 Tax=Paraferrimonas sedimenticola TaxID=375674 RepID=A0AA37VWX5_9GAMM|nr:NnrS family protein [Paraferrimonas sedimenticola]GLP96551.1 short-chain dehydrogenase [Paraferrimonas sedimenticola]
MINIDDPAETQSTPALWRLAFRPFFLFASVLACLYIPTWLLAWYQPQWSWFSTEFWAQVVPLWWHPHELIFGFALAIVVGFLLTAVQTWTNQKSLSGWSLAMLFACWAAARLGLLIPLPVSLIPIAILDCLFLLSASFAMGRRIFKVRQWRNAVFPVMLFLAAMVNALSYWALAHKDFVLANQIWQAMLWWLALLITIVGGRVIPFFSAMRLKKDKPQPLAWLDYPLMALMAVIAIQALAQPLPNTWLPTTLALAGSLQLVRFLRWKPWQTVGEPMLWSLHLAYAFLPLTLLLIAVYWDNPFVSRQLLHLFAIGTMASLCLSMISRVSLGHTSRNVYQGPNMALAFISLALAALLRTLMPIILPDFTLWWHWGAAAFWFLAFAVFVWHYAPILTRPRVDGRPG